MTIEVLEFRLRTLGATECSAYRGPILSDRAGSRGNSCHSLK